MRFSLKTLQAEWFFLGFLRNGSIRERFGLMFGVIIKNPIKNIEMPKVVKTNAIFVDKIIAPQYLKYTLGHHIIVFSLWLDDYSSDIGKRKNTLKNPIIVD